jgi:hypothetical protein
MNHPHQESETDDETQTSNHFLYYSWTDDGTTSNAAVKIAP